MLQQKETSIQCPYCGETIDVFIDDSSGSQSYYEDCSVCCAPILFILTETETGDVQLHAQRDDE